MKKILSALISFILLQSVFAQTPEIFRGIWKGEDRYIFWGENNETAVILKDYYGWYYDRAAEPEEFENQSARKRNIATGKQGKRIQSAFNKISGTDDIWEITFSYDKKTKSVFPVFILDDKLYVDFLVKIPYSEEHSTGAVNSENTEDALFYGYWQGLNTSDSIRIHERKNADNIISWYITQQGAYRLRFWQTGMKTEDTKAAFADGSMLYTVNKHIFSAGQNYTCVNGKSSNIRNVEKYPEFPLSCSMNPGGTVLTLKKPYLTKMTEPSSSDELLKIIEEANSRRKPDPAPLFPEENLDWHWDLINELEKGNAQIQAVRERQKSFGPRAQDIEKKK